MGKRKQRQPGPQLHAEGQHGEKTHRRFVEQLQESAPMTAESPDAAGREQPAEAKGRPVEGHHRLHEDRIQHDEAEKDSEKVRALRQVRRGDADEHVLSHARIPHEGDSR